MSAGLVPEPPLLLMPKLAAKIGVPEALMLQQLHFWTRSVRPQGGWIYNTIAEWREQFPFYSETTIKRTWVTLRDQGLVEKGHSKTRDRTTHYRIVYSRLAEVVAEIPSDQTDPMAGQFDPMDGSIRPDVIHTETTQREPTSGKPDAKVVKGLFEFWVATLEKRSPKFSDKRRRVLTARLAEGFTADEIKLAIVGVTRSPHHMGQNDRGPNGTGKPFNDLTLICRDPEHLEDFRDLGEGPAASKAAFDKFLHKEVAGA